MKFFFLLLMAVLAGIGAAVAGPEVPPHAVILMYHHVSDNTPASTSVSPDLFEEHLEYLERHDFRIWSLAAVADSLRSGGSLPDSVVVFTFDDGYRSVYEEAFPRLRQRGWPFTVFVSTDAIDHHSGPVLSWDKLGEMAGSGATIASHGRRHRHMQRLEPGESRDQWRERTLAELRHSQQRILAEVGQQNELVAFPYGEFDEHLLDLVRDLNWTGFGQQSGAAGRECDLAGLPRFPMAAGFASLEGFPVKVGSLPLPVRKAEPADLGLKFDAGSVMLGAESPSLRLELAPGGYQSGALAAYASGQGAAMVDWIDQKSGLVEIRAVNDIPPGRSRYNVTAPARNGKRWYWYSFTWIAGAQHRD